MGDDLLSHKVSLAVPSALAGLTSLFGMGRGDPRRHRHPYIKWDFYSIVKPGAERLTFENRIATIQY
jgi:hypothetical protein